MINKLRNYYELIIQFFPIQLLINNFKKNQVLLIFWFLLFSIITNNFGKTLGIPYLFFDPEYLHEVSYKSMFIMGASFGIFTIAYFITSYILDSHRFPFLGSLQYPLAKFCLNNSFFPFAFIVTYLYQFVNFQSRIGFQAKGEIFLEASSFVVSFVLTLLLIFGYFVFANKRALRILAISLNEQLRRNKINTVRVLKSIKTARQPDTVTHYFDLLFRIKKVEENKSYDKSLLLKVIDQHHLNAVMVELLIFALIIIIGYFRDNPNFQIPAAASGLLLFSFFIMFTGAFSYWLRGWAITGIIILFVITNQLVKKDFFNTNYEAFGINYNTDKAIYNLEEIEEHCSEKVYHEDRNATLKILENWKAKFPTHTKPKMVFVCTSGGGQRAAVWTTRTLQYVDSSLNGKLMDHTMLITGASGGLIGASYYRELYLRQKLKELDDLHTSPYYEKIALDVLNPIIFSMVVGDFFLRFQKFDYDKYRYYKGRGYAFEHQINQNTDFLMARKVQDYAIYEKESMIPMVIMSPTIINDGRKLFIAAQPISYMAAASPYPQQDYKQRIRGIDFMRFFEKQDAANLHMLSALRMSATFPYVTPNVTLPSVPKMEVMDAGLSDNFGVSDAVQFIYHFREWIAENTDGIVIVTIRDSDKNPPVNSKDSQSIMNKIFNPIGSLYTNWDYLQDFNNDNSIIYASSWFKNKLDLVSFEYIPTAKDWELLKEMNVDVDELEHSYENERAALSWHLTTRERESIKRTIHEKNNVEALNKLSLLLK